MRKLPDDQVRATTLRMRVSRPLMDKIKELAEQERRSVSFMAQMLIEEAIAERERDKPRRK
jgi:predicted transcriptional regulator